MALRFHPWARQELIDAVAYYDSISQKLADDFVAEVENAITRIQNFPDAWPKFTANARRCRVNRFPYGVVYRASTDEILIVAVMHLHRKPDYWIDRI
ncbi:MAG TPA: type II toxin-antitoxin system RelE/ParE family toxin [Blastocatellia bacterium]|nr:type II toxin-antitoxin system RelE/ParE family toxin [Blastocatellia bacterium]